MHDFGVELHAVYFPILLAEYRIRARLRSGKHLEPCGKGAHAVGMAHPAHARLRDSFGKRTVLYERKFAFTVFARFGMLHLAAEQTGNKLRAITNAQNGNAEREQLFGDAGRAFAVYAVRTAREDNADRIIRFYFLDRHIARFQIAVNFKIAHAPRDQLVILSAEIKY